MSVDQVLTLLVLAAVVAALIWDKLRADVVALAGAAFLLMTLADSAPQERAVKSVATSQGSQCLVPSSAR